MKISRELVTKSLNLVQGIQILALKCLYFHIFCYPWRNDHNLIVPVLREKNKKKQGTKYSRDQPGTFFSGIKKHPCVNSHWANVLLPLLKRETSRLLTAWGARNQWFLARWIFWSLRQKIKFCKCISRVMAANLVIIFVWKYIINQGWHKHICHASGICWEILGNTGKYDL